jgi:hypothetical protein
VLSHASLETNGDVESSTGGHSTTDTGHLDDSNVIKLDVCGRLRDKDKALIQEIKKTFIGLD